MACFSRLPFLVNSTTFHQMLRARNMSHPWVLFLSFGDKIHPQIPSPPSSKYIRKLTTSPYLPPAFTTLARGTIPCNNHLLTQFPGGHPCCVPSTPGPSSTTQQQRIFKSQAPPLRNPTPTSIPPRAESSLCACYRCCRRGPSGCSSSPTLSPPWPSCPFHSGHPAGPWTCQVRFCLRAFTVATPSTWDAVPSPPSGSYDFVQETIHVLICLLSLSSWKASWRLLFHKQELSSCLPLHSRHLTVPRTGWATQICWAIDWMN